MKFAATLQQIKRSLNVDFTVQEWLFDRRPDPSTGCKVDNDVKRLCLEELSHGLVVANVPMAKRQESRGVRMLQQLLDIRLFHGWSIEIIKIIHADNALAGSTQACTEV
jgi:hypothetical protein